VDSKLLWYTARASGLVTWTLLAATVLWGLAQSTRLLRGRKGPKPAWMLDLHRFLGAAAVVFLGVHITSIALDTYVHFGLVELFVPFASHWHPLAVAWGIAGLYLLVAIELTSLLKAKVSKRLWRSTHYLSYPLFIVATVHGLSAGMDRHDLAVQVGMLSISAVIAALTAHRFVAVCRKRRAEIGAIRAITGHSAA
jgi:predicted ferric reductase